MRMVLTLALGGLAGCSGSKDGPPVTPTGDTGYEETGTVPDDETDAPLESLFVFYGYMGQATIDKTQGTYVGTETLYAYEQDGNTFVDKQSVVDTSAKLLCEVIWTTATATYPAAGASSCMDEGMPQRPCAFTFDVTYGPSSTQGDLCEHIFGGTSFTHNGRGIGYIADFRVGSSSYGDALMTYYSVTQNGQTYTGWYPASGYYRFQNNNFASYNTTTGEFWWDLPLFDYYQLPAP